MTRHRYSTTRSQRIGLLVLAMTSVPAAFAHDIWITAEKRPEGQLAVVSYGDVDKRELADRQKIASLELHTASGTTDLRLPLTPGRRQEAPVLESRVFTAAPGSVITVAYDNGFWLTKQGDQKETNTSLLMVPKGIEPHWTVKYGKLLTGPGSFALLAKARGEFVVLKDPFKLAVGEKLPVRIVIDGKPIAGTRVRYNDGVEAIAEDKVPFVTTNAEGIAEIPLERKGPYLIATDPNVPPVHPALSHVDHVYVALTFDLGR